MSNLNNIRKIVLFLADQTRKISVLFHILPGYWWESIGRPSSKFDITYNKSTLMHSRFVKSDTKLNIEDDSTKYICYCITDTTKDLATAGIHTGPWQVWVSLLCTWSHGRSCTRLLYTHTTLPLHYNWHSNDHRQITCSMSSLSSIYYPTTIIVIMLVQCICDNVQLSSIKVNTFACFPYFAIMVSNIIIYI